MNDLQRKITSYFQQNPSRRVLFFFDAHSRHADDVAALTNDTFELLRLDPPYAYFGMKVRLSQRATTALPVLLYVPGQASPGQPSPQTQNLSESDIDHYPFPLLDLLVADDELRLDPVAELMARHGLQAHQRSLVERYEKELTRKDPTGLLLPLLRPEAFDETALQQGLIARMLGFKTLPDSTTLLAKFLADRADRPADQANYLTRIDQLGIDAPLRRRLADTLFDGPVTEPLTISFVQQMVLRLKYNLMVGTLPTDHEPYASLRLHRTDTLSRLAVLREAIGPIALERLLVRTGEAVQEEKVLARYGVDTRYGYYTPRLRELVLEQLCTEAGPSVPASQFSLLDELLTDLPDKHPQQALLLTVRHGLTLFQAIGDIPTYRLDTPEAYIQYYEQTFYRIDTLYRWFVQTRREWQVVTDEQVNGDEIAAWLTPFEQRVHERYDRFLLELNREWLACLKERGYDLRSIDVPKQHDFYRQAVVRPHLRETNQKVAVLISDGLRYEIARDLQAELNQDAKSQATVGIMMTALPSATWLGMANLLPHSELQFDGQTVTINGQHTKDIEGRNAVLRATNPRSQAIAYNALESMSRVELRELFKLEIVYVYHNRIDDIGDKRQSEGETVKAVRETIDELKRLIKNLHSQYNVARVLLTADHGFIYQHVAPDDLTLMKAPDVTAKLEKNRYLLTGQTNSTTAGSHSFLLSKASALTTQADWHILVPEGVNRYRRQGSGTRYVHGGASLQEVLVPILESSRKREEVGQKVTVRLVREELTLLANQVKLLLLQEQRVTDADRPRTVAIGLYVGNELASNRVELLFDSVAEGASGRTRDCTLHLTGNLPPQRQYTLRISDIADELNPIIERPVSNKTIIERDF